MKLQYKKYMIFLLGIAILTLGVSMTVKSDIGAGSYDSINFAIADILNTKVSLAISMTAFLVLIITAYIRPRETVRRLTAYPCYFILWERAAGLQDIFMTIILPRVTKSFLKVKSCRL